MISVVVPAHDEESTIARCLDSLLSGSEPGELEIVVACNGCTDGTADVARSYGPPVRVVTTEVASKREALDLGDRAATGFPRVYVDADVRIDVHALRALAEPLDAGDALISAPSLEVDTSRSSAVVRSYYRLHQALPSIRDDVVGRGVYVLSRAGRERFGDFPELGDDHFVRCLFERHERRCVTAAVSVVDAPRTARSLVHRKARVLAGNTMVARDVGSRSVGPTGLRGVAEAVRSRPSLVVDVPAFLLVAAAARLRIARARLGRTPLDWGRDDSRASLVAP